MNLTITKILRDSKEKIILNFPVDTLLDNISIDLWSYIIRYLDLKDYLIGDAKVSYIGYHPVTNEEFNMEKFKNYYFANDGIKFKAEYNTCEKQFLMIGDKFLAGADDFLCDARLDEERNGGIYCHGKLTKHHKLKLIDSDCPELVVVLFISDFV